jgi:NADPH:quinone reductase-like Zn-dependent oxidoreductase
VLFDRVHRCRADGARARRGQRRRGRPPDSAPAGARVVATAGRDDLAYVRGLGADVVCDYRADRFEDHARDVDVVLDSVGGETLARSFAVLKRGGALV